MWVTSRSIAAVTSAAAAAVVSSGLVAVPSCVAAPPCPRRPSTPQVARQIPTRSMATSAWLTQGSGLVALEDMRRFMTQCLAAVGAPSNSAAALADVLVDADYRGHYSHGLNRLEMYIKEIKDNISDPHVEPEILKESPATAWVDGRNGLGPVVGNFCMQLAIKKAEETGIGWVVCKGSNHYGIAAWYSKQALEKGMIGMTCTNTSPFMSPTGSKAAALGTNPLSVAAPAQYKDSFVLDMATTAVAVGKIELQQRKQEPIPHGWAQDMEGRSTSDADLALQSGCLMPLGGAEETSGYKGYGLALMVEVFCGVLGGAAYGPFVRKWGLTTDQANLGQCFMALNPDCFAPGFEERLYQLMYYLRGMDPAEPGKKVKVAGDPERENMKKVDKAGGITYHTNQLKSMMTLAEMLDVDPVQIK